MNYESNDDSSGIQDSYTSSWCSSSVESDWENELEAPAEDIPDEENYTYVKNDHEGRNTELKNDYSNFDLK